MNSVSVREITVLMQLSFLSKKPIPVCCGDSIPFPELPGFALPGDGMSELSLKSGFEQ